MKIHVKVSLKISIEGIILWHFNFLFKHIRNILIDCYDDKITLNFTNSYLLNKVEY